MFTYLFHYATYVGGETEHITAVANQASTAWVAASEKAVRRIRTLVSLSFDTAEKLPDDVEKWCQENNI